MHRQHYFNREMFWTPVRVALATTYAFAIVTLALVL